MKELSKKTNKIIELKTRKFQKIKKCQNVRHKKLVLIFDKLEKKLKYILRLKLQTSIPLK